MSTELRERSTPGVHHSLLVGRPTADVADVWWQRWSLGPLPMVRASIRPRTQVKAVNQALVRQLGYSDQDTPSIVRSIMGALQSYTEATGESTGAMLGPRLMTLDLKRQDGTTFALRMFLVPHEGRQSGELSVVGVGVPPSADTVSVRRIPRTREETGS